MAHLHCIEHGKRVVVVRISPFDRDPRAIGGHPTVLTLHRNGGRSSVRCNSMLKIRDREYTSGMVNDRLTQVRRGWREGKPQQTSR